jgi:TonB family protein
VPRTIRILLSAGVALGIVAADLNTLLDLARAARRQNDIAAAQSAYDSAFELAMSEPDRQLTATAVEVSTFYSQQNNLERTEAVLKRAIDAEDSANISPIKETSLFMSLADLYSRERRLTDLASIQTRLVKAWEAGAGPRSVVVANVLCRLSNTQVQTGNFLDAEQSIQRALTILETEYGVDAPTVGYASGLLSTIEKHLGKNDAAGAASDKASAVRQKQAASASAARVGGPVSSPHQVSRKEPAYSEEARKRRIQGSITLSLVVDESGNPRDVAVLLPLGAGLDQSAVDAVRQWRFQPGEKNGHPVAVQATVEVTFRLI